MKENVVFYKCQECDNLIGLISGDAKRMQCCGKNMVALEVNSPNGTIEKHMPVYEKRGNEITVKVGEVSHPMEEEHYIMWIAQVTENSTTRIKLEPNKKIDIKFPYIKGSSIYAYCNKHGLWKKEVE